MQKYTQDINMNGPCHSTKWNTSKLTTQPISVDIFPRTRKKCNLVLPYFLWRKNAKIHSRHQSDAIVPRRDGSIDKRVQQSWQMLTGESPVVVKVGQPLSQ